MAKAWPRLAKPRLAWPRRAIAGLIVASLAVAALVLVTAQGRDPGLYPPAAGALSIPVGVVDHGYHAGLILPVAQLRVVASVSGDAALLGLTQRFQAYDWLEIGWGDDNFYRNVPSVSLGTLPYVLKALFAPGNRSIVHVVGFSGPPQENFPASRHVSLALGGQGFARLSRFVGAVFDLAEGQVTDAGPGLYGPSRFFRAKGEYSLLNLCNHWTGRALAAAGVPYSPVLSTFSVGLIADLRWRAVP